MQTCWRKTNTSESRKPAKPGTQTLEQILRLFRCRVLQVSLEGSHLPLTKKQLGAVCLNPSWTKKAPSIDGSQYWNCFVLGQLRYFLGYCGHWVAWCERECVKVGEENITLTQEHLHPFLLLLWIPWVLSEFNRHFKD